MTIELREYQKQAVEFIQSRKKVILADKMGLGKTAICLNALTYPTLVVCDNNAIPVWLDEINKWLQVEPLLFTGNKQQRQKLRKQVLSHGIVICNYYNMREILQIKPRWKTVIFDEAHKLRNRNTRTLYPIAKMFITEYLFLVTGTPVIKGAQDLWTLLNLIHPKNFSSYWRFVNRYCIVYDDLFGVHVEGTHPHYAGELRSLLKHYMIRRTPEEVDLELPELTRQKITLDLPQELFKIYNELSEELYVINPKTDELIITPNQLSNILRLRQILVQPQLLELDYKSVGLDYIIEEIIYLDEPAVIFSPFRDIFTEVEEEYLWRNNKKLYLLLGGQSPEHIRKTLHEYKSDTNGVLFSTIQLSQSWDVTNARIAYVLGFDWNPNVHYQAETRLHRFNQKSHVLIKYITHKNTIDEHLVDILNGKITWADLILNPSKFSKWGK